MGIYIGIDPGANGGIALLVDKGSLNYPPANGLITTQLKGMTKSDILRWIKDYSVNRRPFGVKCVAMMEQVTGYIAKNTNKETGEDYNRGDRSFQFGRSYGALEMALIAAEFIEGKNYHQVRPQVWQSAFGLKRSKGMSQGAWKNVAKKKAQELYPQYKITLAISDSILIATYCMRWVTNTLTLPIEVPQTERVDL